MEMIVQATKTFGIMYRCWHFDELLVWWAAAFDLFSPPSWKVVLQSSVTVWTFSPLVIVIVVVVFTKYSPSVHMNAVPERGVQNMQTVACVCVWFCSWMQSNKFAYSRSWTNSIIEATWPKAERVISTLNTTLYQVACLGRMQQGSHFRCPTTCPFGTSEKHYRYKMLQIYLSGHSHDNCRSRAESFDKNGYSIKRAIADFN